MPQPTSSSLQQSVPLLNFTLATIQDDANFIVRQATKPFEVDDQAGTYYTYDTGNYNRIEMGPRGSSSESRGSGWTLSTDTYSCKREAVHKDVDWADAANADQQVDPDMDAVEWLANQARLRSEQKWASAFFTTGVWTLDITGVAAGPSTNEVLQWDQPTADPQAQIQTYQAYLQGLIGREGNTFIAGADLHRTLITNPVYRDMVKHVAETDVKTMKAKMAAFLGVENYYAAGGFHTSSAEGLTTTVAQILDADDGWLGYVHPAPGKKTLTAFQIFAWKGGGKYGTATEGLIARSFDDPKITSTRHEIELFWDMKRIAADAGVFFNELTG